MQHEWPFRNHTNDQLLAELRASRESEVTHQVKVLRILEEVDRRRLFAIVGFSSLYQFCVGALRMSEHEAYLRMSVARTARRFPVIFEMIERGKLHMTAVDKLAAHLTEENHTSLLEAAVHKTKREVEELIAARFPQPDVSESVRRLKAAPPALSKPTRRNEPPPMIAPGSAPPREELAVTRPKAEPRREAVQPLSAERYAVRFTASERCRDLLQRAKELMSHRSPNADGGEIVEEALAVFVEQLEKKKFHTTSRPRPQLSEPTNARQIPAEVKRKVYARDGGRCTYVGSDGHRCESRAFLEFDHAVPIARGGKSTAENVRLRCRVHNDLAARQDFGDEQMSLYSAGFRPVTARSASYEDRPSSEL